MGTHTGRLGKLAIKKEATWGTYLTPDLPLSFTSESLENQIEHQEDSRLLGDIFTNQLIKVGEMVTGSIPLTMHPLEIGPLMDGTLGKNETPAEPFNAIVLVYYTGSEKYASLEKSGNNLTAKVGDDQGSAVADNNFGTLGVVDLTAVGITATALQVAIDGYTGWTAVLLGLATSTSTDIDDFTQTAIVENSEEIGSKFLFYSIASTTAKSHRIIPALADENLLGYSVCVDRTLGVGEAIGFTGMKIGSTGISIAAKDILKLDLSVTAKVEEIGKTYPSVDLPQDDPFVASMASVVIDKIKSNELKELSISINNNITDDGVIGSETISEQIRQGGTIEVSGSQNLTHPDGSYQHRAKYLSSTPVETVYYFEHREYADLANLIKFAVLIRIPKLKFTNYNAPVSGPDRITVNMAGTAEREETYGHIEIYVIDTDTTVY